MADIPVPRSRSQILGGMINTITSKDLPPPTVGSAILSILESAAQSDLRSSQDIFDLLNSTSLESAQGEALIKQGLDEDLRMLGQRPSSGYVTISDSSITKIASNIYQGGSAPIPGSVIVLVDDASAFPASGEIYLGRGTSNYEGPLAYSSVVFSGTYWTITLVSGTTKPHNVGEGVVVAQGGNRLISVGTVVRTPQGNATTAIQFSTLYAATIPDGETVVSNVMVRARSPGIAGNVAANSIVEFVTTPFSGATVTNPLPLTNGTDTERPEDFKARIRNARKTRTKATSLAVQNSVLGATAPDTNDRVLSSSLVSGDVATLYIDDGTGYQETTEGVVYEPLVEAAEGGESVVQLANGRPVAKAFLKTSLQAPFSLSPQTTLGIMINGIVTQHLFVESEFRSISNASAYEVAAAINADSNLTWAAKVVDSGTRVVVSAKAEVNEDIAVVGTANDANNALGFSPQAKTIWLYRDDQLLSKDGTPASLTSKAHGEWGNISNGDVLGVKVDGIALSIPITNAAFINAGTPYLTVNRQNSLESWATVLNSLIPGVTTIVSGGALVLTSNKGSTSTASLEVSGDVGAAMFTETSSVGTSKDFSLQRNTGQIKLLEPLEAGSRLTAGSFFTRGFIETTITTTFVVSGTPTSVPGDIGAEMWFVVDGDAQTVTTGAGPGTVLNITGTAASWGTRVRYTSASGDPIFGNVAPGHWIIVTDPSILIENRGAFRVVDSGTTWVEVEQLSTWVSTQLGVTLTINGFRVLSCHEVPQRVFLSVTGNPYTPSAIASSINSQINGALATTYRTSRVRLQTNTFVGGDIAFVAGNSEGLRLGFPRTDARTSGVSHLASAIASHTHLGTPTFSTLSVISSVAPDMLTFFGTTPTPNGILNALKTFSELPGNIGKRWGNDDFWSPIEYQSGGSLFLRSEPTKFWLPEQRVCVLSPYATGPNDTLSLVIDNDAVSKRYSLNMFRRVVPTTNTYGITTAFRDADNGSQSLAAGFGTDFDWRDFAVFMKARTKALGILWRFYRHGQEGNFARMAYCYPTTQNSTPTITTNSQESQYADIRVFLGSGPDRTLPSIRPTSYVGLCTSSIDPFNSLHTVSCVINMNVTAGVRVGGLTTLTVSTPLGVGHGVVAGTQIWVQSNDPNFTTGPKIVSSVLLPDMITYVDALPDVGAMAGTITVSLDSMGEVSLAGSGGVTGDIVTVNGLTGKTSSFADARIDFTQQGITAISPVITWIPATTLHIFPLAGNTTANIVASVNAVTNSSLSGFEYAPGVIEWATYEAPPDGLGGAVPWYNLYDGLNFVRYTNTPVLPTDDFVFTFKVGCNPALATNADWEHEDVRLVPITAQNVVDFLDSSAVSALFGVVEITDANSASCPQITTITPGSSGAVEGESGGANSCSVAVVGSATAQLGGIFCTATVPSAPAIGLCGGHWVAVDNTKVGTKTTFTSSTSMAINSSGLVVLAGTTAWDYSSGTNDLSVGLVWQIEKQGAFIAFVTTSFPTNFSAVREGDWVVVDPKRVDSTYPTNGTISPVNRGVFRVVRTEITMDTFGKTTHTFWIENPVGVEEIGSVDVAFLSFYSIIPNDSLVINTASLGQGNIGTWTVNEIRLTDKYQFVLDTSSRIPTTIPSTSLAGFLGQVVTYEGQPGRLIKHVTSIAPNGTYTDVKFDSGAKYERIGVNFGSVITSLDKLNLFNCNSGVDAYVHNTGLIAESNRILYGDESQSTTYPGVASASANINISGPYLKRISVSVVVRTETGIDINAIRDEVRSEIIAVINDSKVGEDVSISELVSAAQSVNGVVAVSVLSPIYSVGHDVITVQPHEKALVVDPQSDVLVSFIGE